jgi:hypothetical protein
LLQAGFAAGQDGGLRHGKKTIQEKQAQNNYDFQADIHDQTVRLKDLTYLLY